jgi:hypothetical protein
MKTIQALIRVARCFVTLLEAGYAVQPLSVQHGGGL